MMIFFNVFAYSISIFGQLEAYSFICFCCRQLQKGFSAFAPLLIFFEIGLFSGS
jgi:hypothetical protein